MSELGTGLIIFIKGRTIFKKNLNSLNVLPLYYLLLSQLTPPQCAVIYGILSPLSFFLSLSMTESLPCIEGKLSPDIYHNLAVIL